MAKSHYDTLGIKRSATPSEVRSAYRKIVLQHHPDRSKDPRSASIFLAATGAYEVLSEPEARARYDETLDVQARRARDIQEEQRRAAARATASSARPNWTPSRDDPKSIAQDILRLRALFARGSHDEAERLARQIADVAPRHPAPYAVLGDIARLQGNVDQAAKMYAYAVQFEPSNGVYQRRYEELLAGARVVEDRFHTTTLAPHDGKVLAPMAVGIMLLAASLYLAFSTESAVFKGITIVGSWTLGLPIVLFLTGIGIGAALAAGNLLDRLRAASTAASGGPGPAVTLGLVAVVNFWVAALLYLMLGLFQRAWNFSMSRLLGAVAVSVPVLAIAASAGRSHISFGQTLIWGGNVTYIGALLGWLVADSFRA